MTPHDFGFARSITLALPACVLCLCYLLILTRARREITRAALLLRALAALCATLAFLAPYYNASTTTRATILLLLDDSQSLARKLDTRTVQQDASNLAALLQRHARQYNAPMTLATLSGQTLRSLEDYSSAKLQETRSPIA
ncbi:MAG: hypothetical protein Q4G03_10250, partial [Planctomycetia bacterium]|nr:hypothetical protein [Planctomycetia bacterium]